MDLLVELGRVSEYPSGYNGPAWRTWDEVFDEGHGLTQIGLQRTACFGECPVYTVIVHASGRVDYHGRMYVPRLGTHTGMVSLPDFQNLAQFIAGTRFWEMESYYDFRDCVVSDCGGACVLVATENRRRLVSNYGNSGPPELWAIAGLIDLLVASVAWE